MWQRIILAAAFGPALSGAALIEQDRVKALGIEQPAVIGLAAAAGTAMQIDRGDSVCAADRFDVDFVTIADGKLLRCQRCERIGALTFGIARAGISGVDLTFATHLAASS